MGHRPGCNGSLAFHHIMKKDFLLCVCAYVCVGVQLFDNPPPFWRSGLWTSWWEPLVHGSVFFDGPWPLSRSDQDVGMRTLLQEKISPIMALRGGRLSSLWFPVPFFYSVVISCIPFSVFCWGFSTEFLRNGADLCLEAFFFHYFATTLSVIITSSSTELGIFFHFVENCLGIMEVFF